MKWGVSFLVSKLKMRDTWRDFVKFARRNEFDLLEFLFEHPYSFCTVKRPFEKELKREASGFSLSIHAPFKYNDLTAPCKPLREASLAEAKATVDYAARLDAEFVVVHIGHNTLYSRENYRELLEDCPVRLFDYAHSRGMRLLAENIPARFRFDRGFPATPQEFRELENVLGRKVGVCFDPPHAMASGLDVYACARSLEPRIVEVHLQDGSRTSEHLALGEGEIDFKRLFRSLDGFDGAMTFELFRISDLKASLEKLEELGLH